ncbi:MAG: hypothetical protein II124_05645 [Clostridia bacterium]|nr:hypothetical protein [Clostridia bacterium]
MAKKKESPRIAFRLTEREKKQVPGIAAFFGLYPACVHVQAGAERLTDQYPGGSRHERTPFGHLFSDRAAVQV